MARIMYTTLPLVVICCVLGMLLSQSCLQEPQPDAALTAQRPPLEEDEKTKTILKEELNEKQQLVEEMKKKLEDLEKKLETREKENEDLEQQLADCKGRLDSSPAPKIETKSDSESTKEELKEAIKRSPFSEAKERLETQTTTIRHPVCRLLSDKVSGNISQFVVPAAPFVWTELLEEIHTASDLLPNDPKYLFHDFTAHLLQLVSARLPRTTQTLPRTWSSFQAILDVAWKRYQYLQEHPEALQPPEPGQPPKLAIDYPDQDKIPRPVRVLIMGGSLLVGTNCRKLMSELKMTMGLPLKQCSWGHRLGAFLNQFLGMPLVEITSIAVGGTNTATGSLLLHHELLPPEAQQPDVVVDGYATNDMHHWTMEEAGHAHNGTLGDAVRTMVENFYRNATKLGAGKKCDRNNNQPPPLVLYLDDYNGNEQREVLATMEGSSAIHSLARYYGFAMISYPDLVRDWIYADTHETWFSPAGWYDKKNQSAMVREIHPNLGAHIVIAWVVAYNVLNMVTTFCSVEPWHNAPGSAVNYDVLSQPYETSQQSTPQMPVLRGETKYVPPGKPKSPPPGLPPRLTKTLSLEDISELWEQEGINHEQRRNKSAAVCREGQQKDQPAKCSFAWVSRIRVAPLPDVPETEGGRSGDAEKAYWKAHSVHDFGNPKNSSWAFQHDHKKIGVCPKQGVGSEMLLQIPRPSASETIETDQPIVDTVTIFYMKSYSEMWQNSTVRFDITAKLTEKAKDWTSMASVELCGFHPKHTTETYTETIHLDSSINIQHLRVAATLIKGKTFKIMGLLACRLNEQD